MIYKNNHVKSEQATCELATWFIRKFQCGTFPWSSGHSKENRLIAKHLYRNKQLF